jgi:hypothetical protein
MLKETRQLTAGALYRLKNIHGSASEDMCFVPDHPTNEYLHYKAGDIVLFVKWSKKYRFTDSKDAVFLGPDGNLFLMAEFILDEISDEEAGEQI